MFDECREYNGECLMNVGSIMEECLMNVEYNGECLMNVEYNWRMFDECRV